MTLFAAGAFVTIVWAPEGTAPISDRPRAPATAAPTVTARRAEPRARRPLTRFLCSFICLVLSSTLAESVRGVGNSAKQTNARTTSSHERFAGGDVRGCR